jgi:ElaB/YqjD/DUF883 family membrane-anchored ribosome-binding protein
VTADQEREEIGTSMERHREELRSALEDVKEATVSALAPREQLRRHPYPWLAAAAAVGFYLARRETPRLR